MSNCVESSYIELIARNAILKMLSDHTLQAGLRDCECSWLGHEAKVATCNQLADVTPESLDVNSEGELILTLGDGSQISVPLAPFIQELVDAAKVVALNATASGELVLTFGDGSQLTVNLTDLVMNVLNAYIAERWPCGLMDRVNYEEDQPFKGMGSDCSPFEFDCEKAAPCIGEVFASDEADAPSTTETPVLPTTMFGARTAVLGQPDGWMNIGGKKVPYWD